VAASPSINAWNLESTDAACPTWDMSFYAAGRYSCFTVQDFPFDTWIHLAIGYDAVRKQAYVNGEQRLDLADSSITFDANDIYLASDSNSGAADSFYAGPLDDIRIYDRLLSAAEIAALAN
jgi:arabinan endo-1,5-alpha-L-arabinosidase